MLLTWTLTFIRPLHESAIDSLVVGGPQSSSSIFYRGVLSTRGTPLAIICRQNKKAEAVSWFTDNFCVMFIKTQTSSTTKISLKNCFKVPEIGVVICLSFYGNSLFANINLPRFFCSGNFCLPWNNTMYTTGHLTSECPLQLQRMSSLFLWTLDGSEERIRQK